MNQRNEIRDALPTLTQRVLALKGKTYNGSGFHWSLMKTLGWLMWTVNDFDSRYTAETSLLVDSAYADLLERVASAESQVFGN